RWGGSKGLGHRRRRATTAGADGDTSQTQPAVGILFSIRKAELLGRQEWLPGFDVIADAGFGDALEWIAHAHDERISSSEANRAHGRVIVERITKGEIRGISADVPIREGADLQRLHLSEVPRGVPGLDHIPAAVFDAQDHRPGIIET